MRLKDSRQRKFSKFMTYHIFSDVNSYERLTIVHTESVPNEVGSNRRPAGPSLDRLFRTSLYRFLDFLEQVVIDEKTFFYRTCHVTERLGYF